MSYFLDYREIQYIFNPGTVFVSTTELKINFQRNNSMRLIDQVHGIDPEVMIETQLFQLENLKCIFRMKKVYQVVTDCCLKMMDQYDDLLI